MSKHKEEEKTIDVGQVYTKSEQFVENNKTPLIVIVALIVLVVGGWFGYSAYIGGQEVEAQESVWKSQYYMEIDSLDKALLGDGQYFGFEYIAENYSGTPSGYLSNYYIGLIYKDKGELDLAIEYLKDAKIKDNVLGAIAIGSIGDCYIDLGEFDEALKYFNKAINHSSNSFTAPIYLNKAAITYEFLENYTKANEYYSQIVEDYGNSAEANQVKKRMARAEQLSK